MDPLKKLAKRFLDENVCWRLPGQKAPPKGDTGESYVYGETSGLFKIEHSLELNELVEVEIDEGASPFNNEYDNFLSALGSLHSDFRTENARPFRQLLCNSPYFAANVKPSINLKPEERYDEVESVIAELSKIENVEYCISRTKKTKKEDKQQYKVTAYCKDSKSFEAVVGLTNDTKITKRELDTGEVKRKAKNFNVVPVDFEIEKMDRSKPIVIGYTLHQNVWCDVGYIVKSGNTVFVNGETMCAFVVV